jgi:hypothetical protein
MVSHGLMTLHINWLINPLVLDCLQVGSKAVQSARKERAGRAADKAAEVASPTAAVQQASQAVQTVGAEQAGQGTAAEGGVMAGDLGMVAVKIGMPPQELDSTVTGGCE